MFLKTIPRVALLLALTFATTEARAENHPTNCDGRPVEFVYSAAMFDYWGTTRGFLTIEESPGCGWRAKADIAFECLPDGNNCAIAFLTEGGVNEFTSARCTAAVGQKSCVTGWLWSPTVRGVAGVHTIYGDLSTGASPIILPKHRR